MNDYKIKFYLHLRKAIYLNVNNKNYSTKIVIAPNQWDKGFPKRNQTLLINKLNKIKDNIKDIHLDCFNPINVRLAIKNKELLTPETETIEQFYKDFLLDKENKSKSTYRNNELVINNLQRYIPINLPINKLNKIYLLNFNRKYQKQNYSNSTFAQHQTIIKQFIRKVQFQCDLHNLTDCIKFDISKHITTDIIALDKRELELIKSIKLKTTLENDVRNLYVLSCLTGLRYSDLNHLVNKNNQLLIQKTNKIHSIIITDEIEILIKKLKGLKLNNSFRTQVNRTLKGIFKEAKLDRLVYKNNIQIELYNVISFHSSRKTFVTRLLSQNVNPAMVMKLSTHTSTENFKRYISFSQDDIKEVYKYLEAI